MSGECDEGRDSVYIKHTAFDFIPPVAPPVQTHVAGLLERSSFSAHIQLGKRVMSKQHKQITTYYKTVREKSKYLTFNLLKQE